MTNIVYKKESNLKNKTTLKKNDVLTVTVEDITNLGFGVAKHGGAVIFISGAVSGDVAEIKIIKAASSYYVGKIERIIAYSDKRCESRCKNTSCKSCAYRNISYSEELKIKSGIIRSAFLKEGLSDIEVLPTVASPMLYEYRNKAQYPIARDKNGEYVIGFYAPKTHTVAEAADCPIAPKVFTRIINALRAFFKKYEISVYDEKLGTGLLRHIYLRRSEESGEVLLTLVANGESIPHKDELIAYMTAAFPEICGILLNINEKDTNIILGDEYKTLFGRDYITDTLAGAKLKITAPSFYQVNHGTATLIYKEARRLAALSPNDTLLDLYCGAGSIGLSMADDAGELIGIEIVEPAVECAKYNAALCGKTNAKFYTGDAKCSEALLANAERELGKKILPDVIILDPPRAGCDEELLKFVAMLEPKRIVYISCNPTTLARDVKRMREYGYNTDKVSGWDMFPMTGHVESLVCLTKQTN